MKKKTVTMVLILVILLITTGLSYSGGGPRTYNFGPIVPPSAHPWGENPHTANPPNLSRSSSGDNFPDLTTIPTFTSFAVKFYFNYVVKKTMEGQSSIRQHPSGE